MVLSAASASADPKPPADAQHVVICHATDSYKNPYTTIDVDLAGGWDGHDKHTGPVFSLDIAKHVDWGDIIPPSTYNGQQFQLNWDADGQAIWNNGCALPGATSTSTVTATVTATQTKTETVTATATVTDTATETATETQTETVTADPSTVVSTVTAPASTVTVTRTVAASTSAGASSSDDGTSAAASSSAAVAGVSASRTRSSSDSAQVAAESAGPIPAAVDAGRHAPVSRSGLALWGSLLMAFGGLCGLMGGLRRPRARRAH